ncbi:MAG: aldose 1-epimerase [Reyranella sp.]|nr:aldose 1-epimerase [Reyranella sp.]MDP3162949.1 aldose 1-epimerase [Reyranella sp.]
MTVLSLRAGRLAVDLAPAAGGSITRFVLEAAGTAFDFLRPAGAAAMACYPLVPFSNRIANGRLVVDGEEFVLEPNWPGQRHPMHGDGWARPWQVARQGKDSIELVYEHDGRGGWPFRYRARQVFHLGEEGLAVGMTIENLENRPVPAGLGLHPFFPRDADTELACRVEGVWRADAEVLPVDRIAVPPEWNFTVSHQVDGVVLDNCFDGWDGQATIRWPRHGLGLALEATPPFRHLVIYVPKGQPYFCVEPVSHANGAVAQTSLRPGETLAGEILFRPFML